MLLQECLCNFWKPFSMKHKKWVSFPELLTNRLLLRKLEPADAAAIFALRSDPIVNRYVVRPPVSDIEDGIRFIHRINTSVAEGDCLYWAVVPKQSEELIGTICLWNWNHQYKHAEIGFELMPHWQGKGYMHEAVGKVLPYAFDELHFNKIEAWIHQENKAAIKLVVKNGFEPAKTQSSSETDKAIVIYCKCKPGS